MTRRRVAHDELALAELIVEATNGTTELIQCSSISFDLPVGEHAKDFLDGTTGMTTVAPEGWNLEASDVADGLFTATPKSEANYVVKEVEKYIMGIAILATVSVTGGRAVVNPP